MKRIYAILLTLFGCILVTLGLSVLLLKSGRIQTAAVRLATDELSRGLNTNISIGSVQYDFPMRITLKDIYIEDLQQDTLLYIKDFASAVVRAADTHVCGLFNLTGQRPYTLDEMVDGIIASFSSGITEKLYRPDMPDTPQVLLSRQKAAEVLGWEPQWSWTEACDDMGIECIENPMELMWGPNDNLDMIHA